MSPSCATCAQPYGSALDPASEKPLLLGRHLSCCGRSICARCLNQNKRYETYCPYCQISTEPTALPQGLRDPPAYETLDERIPPPQAEEQHQQQEDENAEPPPYSANGDSRPVLDEKAMNHDDAPDVLHFVSPVDSMRSLALAYNVPVNALRKANNVYSDHLIQARRTILIPGEYYKGPSLSARPLEGEEEEARKQKVRRWMVACKVSEYDVALLYLEQAEWDLEMAIGVYKDDEQWEKEHPLEAKQKMKKGKVGAKDAGMRRFVGSSASVR